MKIWVYYVFMNFLYKFYLVEVEKYWVFYNYVEVIEFYE